jgi:hypothetical protein
LLGIGFAGKSPGKAAAGFGVGYLENLDESIPNGTSIEEFFYLDGRGVNRLAVMGLADGVDEAVDVGHATIMGQAKADRQPAGPLR